jgi:hypothetical protein
MIGGCLRAGRGSVKPPQVEIGSPYAHMLISSDIFDLFDVIYAALFSSV